MKQRQTAPALVLGDHIDTDQIYPGRFLSLTDPQEIGKHALAGIDESIAARFPKGGFLVAGRNFGCGSSREHAPIALLQMGVSAIFAESFARIFYRNAINLGLPPLHCPGLHAAVQTGDLLQLDWKAGTITLPDGNVFRFEPLGESVLRILEAGGIKPLLRAQFGK